MSGNEISTHILSNINQHSPVTFTTFDVNVTLKDEQHTKTMVLASCSPSGERVCRPDLSKFKAGIPVSSGIFMKYP